MNKLLMVVTILAIAVAGLVGASMVQADGGDRVVICHAAGQAGTTKYVTLSLPIKAVFGKAGHFNEPGTPAAGHEDDYLGPCIEPSTTTTVVTTTEVPPSTTTTSSTTTAPPSTTTPPVSTTSVVTSTSSSLVTTSTTPETTTPTTPPPSSPTSSLPGSTTSAPSTTVISDPTTTAPTTTLTVISDPTTTVVTSSTLADTGPGSATTQFAIAAALLAMGGAAVAGSRRRA